jgi:hypothetical protein
VCCVINKESKRTSDTITRLGCSAGKLKYRNLTSRTVAPLIRRALTDATLLRRTREVAAESTSKEQVRFDAAALQDYCDVVTAVIGSSLSIEIVPERQPLKLVQSPVLKNTPLKNVQPSTPNNAPLKTSQPPTPIQTSTVGPPPLPQQTPAKQKPIRETQSAITPSPVPWGSEVPSSAKATWKDADAPDPPSGELADRLVLGDRSISGEKTTSAPKSAEGCVLA